jgi:peptide/nickel transport system permease protein
MTPALRRALGALAGLGATLFGLLLITFLIGQAAPIDPTLALVGDRADAEAVAQARRALGLDDPLPLRFAAYLGKVLSGDLGPSTLTARPVLADLLRVFPATVELATAATLAGLALGLPLGLAGAWWRGRWPDHLARLVGVLGHSVPVFWLGLMALLLFYGTLDWAPGPGRIAFALEGSVPAITGLLLVDSLLAGDGAAFRSALGHLVLPAGVLGLFSAAQIARLTRSYLIEALGQDFVLAARARGLSELRVVVCHALASARGPLVVALALVWGGLLEGSVLTETVFAWPGLGAYMTQALMSADLNAVLGGTLLVGLIFVLVNRGADALQRRLDPRAA